MRFHYLVRINKTKIKSIETRKNHKFFARAYTDTQCTHGGGKTKNANTKVENHSRYLFSRAVDSHSYTLHQLSKCRAHSVIVVCDFV